jgi:hypothetical protein
MENIALLVYCPLLGIVLRRSGRLPENAAAALNSFIIHISLPALIVLYVHELRIDSSLVYPVAAPWMLFLLGLTLFVAAARVARWTAPTTGGLILSGSLANTSFVGLPMIETFYGVSFLGLGILIDQLGTYMVLSTLGIVVAVTFSQGRADTVSLARVFRKVVTFVPFQALLLALAFRPIDFPGSGKANRDRGTDDAGDDFRSRDGAADRRRHRRDGAQAGSAAGYADGWNRYPPLFPDPTAVVVRPSGHLSRERAHVASDEITGGPTVRSVFAGRPHGPTESLRIINLETRHA